MYEEIIALYRKAAVEGNKTAMFHFLVLKYAEQLSEVDPLYFCNQIGAPASFATEFRKMIAVAKLMKQQGAKIV